MRRVVLAAVLLALQCLPPGADAADPATPPGLDAITGCMRANIPQNVRIQAVTITAWDRVGGQRTMKGKVFATREDGLARVMMRIESPSDLAGAAYLVRESDKGDEMYLYLPAVQKVRRITGQALDGQLWGTDLSYNDVKQMQSAYDGAGVTLEADVPDYEDRAVHALSFKPAVEEGSRYSVVRTLVDKKTCVALKLELTEPAGLRKVLTVQPADLKQSDERWYASKAEIRDVKNGTRTRLVITGVKADDKLAGRYFSPHSFHLGN
ncbi:MAG: outer membrane lipoprotein-sorting protein [Gammaproteobacteria bacterium]